MPKKIHLAGHLDTAELGRRYRAAKDPAERSHYQIVWLLCLGKRTAEVAEATGYSPPWIREVARRYNESGAAGLGDRRRRNPGGKDRALLTPERREELGRALQGPPPDGGMWSGPKVAEWIGERIGRGVGAQRGWEYLRALGYAPQIPRPAHAKADAAEQEAFRKG